MAQRLDLQELLVGLLGSTNVYFQPPESLKLEYPCIVYSQDMLDIDHADNVPYKHTKRYLVTVMHDDPDSDIPDKIAMLPLCSFDRAFTADNLHHTAFRLFF